MIAGIGSFQSFPVLLLESPNRFSKIATAIIGDVVASRNWKYMEIYDLNVDTNNFRGLL